MDEMDEKKRAAMLRYARLGVQGLLLKKDDPGEALAEMRQIESKLEMTGDQILVQVRDLMLP
ncbi:MAG: hypothetical protein WEG36_07300 [Gemmatimonadota bacterium]